MLIEAEPLRSVRQLRVRSRLSILAREGERERLKGEEVWLVISMLSRMGVMGGKGDLGRLG